ncbi:hypothetical protein GJAV_G00211530, partial [Gymnothorax javanicus]
MASYKFSTLLSVAVLSCISWVATARTEYCQGPCPAGWVYNNLRCFKYFTEQMTWIDAEIHCRNLGGNLASEDSERDHQFLKALQKRNDHRNIPFWIGLSDRHKEGTWIWSDGSPLLFTKWNPLQPRNYGNNEHCAHSNYGHKKDWNDAPCNRKYPYICAMRFHYGLG